MAQLKITIDRLGNPVIDAEGFTGNACAVASGAIEQALAGASSSVENKPEMYSTETEGQKLEQGW